MNKIINPENGMKYNINDIDGKNILFNYVNQLGGERLSSLRRSTCERIKNKRDCQNTGFCLYNPSVKNCQYRSDAISALENMENKCLKHKRKKKCEDSNCHWRKNECHWPPFLEEFAYDSPKSDKSSESSRSSKKCKGLRKKNNECQGTAGCNWIVGKGCQSDETVRTANWRRAPERRAPERRAPERRIGKDNNRNFVTRKNCNRLRKRNNECDGTPGCHWVVGKGCQSDSVSNRDNQHNYRNKDKPIKRSLHRSNKPLIKRPKDTPSYSSIGELIQVGENKNCKGLKKKNRECDDTPGCSWVIGKGCQSFKDISNGTDSDSSIYTEKQVAPKPRSRHVSSTSICKGLSKKNNVCDGSRWCNWVPGKGCQSFIDSDAFINSQRKINKCRGLRDRNICNEKKNCEWYSYPGICGEKIESCSELRKENFECEGHAGCKWVKGRGCEGKLQPIHQALLPRRVRKVGKKLVMGEVTADVIAQQSLKKDKNGTMRVSAAKYFENGGRLGDVVDIKRNGVYKCLLKRNNGILYWASKNKTGNGQEICKW